MALSRKLFIFSFIFLCGSVIHAAPYLEPEVKVSTLPIGSSFFRHLAFDYDLDLKKLVKFEKKGFGRAETITFILLSKITGTPLKKYGNKRVKKPEITLRQITEEAGLDYSTLYKTVQAIKKGIEAKRDKNLPPPVFEDQPKAKEKKKKKKKKRKKEKK